MSKSVISFRTAFGPKKVVNVDFSNAISRTHQSFKHETDINEMIRRYEKTGLIAHNVKSQPLPIADYSTAKSYQESVNLVIKAQDSFMQLHSAIRNRFANDPIKLLEFVHNPANRDEAIKLGLIQPVQELNNNVIKKSSAVADDNTKNA